MKKESMKKTTYKDVFEYVAKNAEGINEFSVPLQHGITVCFVRNKRNVDLSRLIFDRKKFSAWSSRRFCKKNNISFYDMRFMQNRMVPMPSSIYSIGNKQYVAVTPKNTGTKVFLKEFLSD